MTSNLIQLLDLNEQEYQDGFLTGGMDLVTSADIGNLALYGHASVHEAVLRWARTQPEDLPLLAVSHAGWDVGISLDRYVVNECEVAHMLRNAAKVALKDDLQ